MNKVVYMSGIACISAFIVICSTIDAAAQNEPGNNAAPRPETVVYLYFRRRWRWVRLPSTSADQLDQRIVVPSPAVGRFYGAGDGSAGSWWPD
jgi:hypothetical protein